MFGDGFRRAVEDAFQVMQFACVLDLDENDLPFAVQGFDVDAVVLVVGTFLVAFALEDFDDLDLFVQHDGQEAVEHVEIGLLAAIDRSDFNIFAPMEQTCGLPLVEVPDVFSNGATPT